MTYLCTMRCKKNDVYHSQVEVLRYRMQCTMFSSSATLKLEMLLEVESSEMKLHQCECLSNYHKHTPHRPILYTQCEQEVSLLSLSGLGLVTFTHNIAYFDLHTVYQTPMPCPALIFIATSGCFIN